MSLLLNILMSHYCPPSLPYRCWSDNPKYLVELHTHTHARVSIFGLLFYFRFRILLRFTSAFRLLSFSLSLSRFLCEYNLSIFDEKIYLFFDRLCYFTVSSTLSRLPVFYASKVTPNEITGHLYSFVTLSSARQKCQILENFVMISFAFKRERESDDTGNVKYGE